MDDLFFSAGTDASGPYTVTVDASRNARRLTIQEGDLTLSGGTLVTFGGGGGITLAAGAGDAIVSSSPTINGGSTVIVGLGRTISLDTGTFTRGARAALNIKALAMGSPPCRV